HREGSTNCYFVTTNIDRRKSLLSDRGLASKVVEAIYFLRRKGRFRLHAFVLMPDHLHLICSPLSNHGLPSIVHSLKSYTAKELNREMGKTGKVWQSGYYSYAIRGLRDLEEKVRYVWENPLRRGLVERPEDYPFSSANGRHEIDRW
ncbi:MAG: transposase, partial [Nitrospinota bacterium]